MNIQLWQFVAWFIALVSFILGLYILLLNAWHTANRHVSALLLLIAANTFATGSFIGATTIAEARLPTLLEAATIPAVLTMLLLALIVLLNPGWLRGVWQWVIWVLYAFCLFPVLLTLIDGGLGTRLWYTGLTTYSGGFVAITEYVGGPLGLPVRMLSQMAPVVAIVFSLYIALFDKQAGSATRRLALVLSIALAIAIALQFGLHSWLGLGTSESSLLSGAVFVLAYTYAGFAQMISERRLQRGSLRPRLTAIVAVVTIPLLVAIGLFLTDRARFQLEQDANEKLRLTSLSIKTNVSTWLDLNGKLLNQMASMPDIVSMDAARQRPVLQATAKAYPLFFLVHTANLNGVNVARNDSNALQNYSDRKWFQGAKAGQLTSEVLVSRTTGRPSLNMAGPIKDAAGNIVGVVSIVSELNDISTQVHASTVGKTGFTYVVDAGNRMVAHPNSGLLMNKNNELIDASQFAPVAALRAGQAQKIVPFIENGQQWRAFVDKMDNGWGIIVQQPESELLTALQALQQVAWVTIEIGAVVLLALVWLSIRQAFYPIGSLTDTAVAIAAGDLNRTAPEESEDELGALARAFNSMTTRLRGLIGSLEQRVAERTADLERRSNYLAASADVGHAAASILESDRLIAQVVELIRVRFDLYYVGLFLLDETGQWAVLRAGTGQAGQMMIARGHKLLVGEGSMIGWSVANSQARVAQIADLDAVRLATVELPETRSEAALPLRSRGRVLGALSVQSSQPNAFDEAVIAVLQVMADQVAVALDNASLFAESQLALEKARAAYGALSREGWLNLLRAHPGAGYKSDTDGMSDAGHIWSSEMEQAVKTGQAAYIGSDGQDKRPLAVPITVRGMVIGVLDTYKPADSGSWTPEEINLLETLAEQMAQALDGARLYQDTQRRAARERLTREIADNIRSATSVDDAVQRAMREMSRALEVDEMVARLGAGKGLLASQPGGRHE